MEENFSMEWNMEESFSMEWKIFSMEWKWNGRKLPVWNMEKSSSIPNHALVMGGDAGLFWQCIKAHHLLATFVIFATLV